MRVPFFRMRTHHHGNVLLSSTIESIIHQRMFPTVKRVHDAQLAWNPSWPVARLMPNMTRKDMQCGQEWKAVPPPLSNEAKKMRSNRIKRKTINNNVTRWEMRQIVAHASNGTIPHAYGQLNKNGEGMNIKKISDEHSCVCLIWADIIPKVEQTLEK